MSLEPTATFLRKAKGRPGGLRKRALDDSPDPSGPSTSEVVVATKKHVANHLVQGTTGLAKRRRQEDAALGLSSSDDDDDSGAASVLVRHSATVQRPRRRSSSPPAEISGESIKESLSRASATHAHDEPETQDDGMYRGAAKQAHKLPKAFGPVKGGPGNVRTITMVDYQPDVCKDYKETGFCGFGDSCKFLHDRGDYLHGWQLDNSFLSSNAAAGSFLAKQAARQNGDGAASDSDDADEDLPFACLICRNPFGKEPVVTLCGHYFDSACAIKRFAKTGKCFACGKGTNGVFNKATKLIAKQKEREELNAAAAAEEREFEEDDDGPEIEGLERVERVDDLASAPVTDGSEDEEEEQPAARPVRRRPIVTIE